MLSYRKTAWLALAASMLFGCGGAASVEDLHRNGEKVTMESALSPKALATCMQRNLAVSSEWAYLPEVDEFMITNVNNGGVNATIEIRAQRAGGSVADLYHVGGWFTGFAENVVKRVARYCH